jgi:hypothetical protein
MVPENLVFRNKSGFVSNVQEHKKVRSLNYRMFQKPSEIFLLVIEFSTKSRMVKQSLPRNQRTHQHSSTARLLKRTMKANNLKPPGMGPIFINVMLIPSLCGYLSSLNYFDTSPPKLIGRPQMYR